MEPSKLPVIVPDPPPRVVLIVVDNADESGTLFRAINTALGPHVKVLEAVNGNDAAEVVKATHIDAVIADNGISGLSGFSLLAELRLTQRKETPFLLRSGDPHSELREHVEKFDAKFLARPPEGSASSDEIVTWLRENLGL